MKLVPVASQYLRLKQPLPFSLRDAEGRLLLAVGRSIDSMDVLNDLAGKALFSEEHESADWNRRLAAAMDQALRQGATLKQVAAARPDTDGRSGQAAVNQTLADQWHHLIGQLDATLRDVRPDSTWRSALMQVHAQTREMAERRLDASLYYLVYEAGHSTHKYSSSHAMLTLLICEQAAPLLGWAPAWIDSLGRAALTMNVAMTRLQDDLAATQLPPTDAMRATISAHAAEGARLLQAAGLEDPLCLAVVRGHHDDSTGGLPLADLAPDRALAQLLRRVDIFCAKISRRANRAPMSPVQAAREACLGPDGKPDEIGGALLRAVGLYPPGSFVELASGEVGIVVARGRRANLPFVASLVSASGHALGEPPLRDTLDRRHAVRAAVPPDQVRVRPSHERLLALR